MSQLALSLRAGFTRDARVQLSYPLGPLLNLIAALFSPLIFYYVARFVGDGVDSQLAGRGGDYFSFVLVGLMWTSLLYVAVRVFVSGVREAQTLGLLETLLQTPTRAATVLMTGALWPLCWAVVQAAGIVTVGVALLGVDLDVDIAAATVSIALSLLLVAAIGMALGATALVSKRGEGIAVMVNSALILLGGFYYPTESLPGLLREIGELLPFGTAVDAVRGSLLAGRGIGDLAGELIEVAAFTLVALPLAVVAVERAVDACRRRGTLGQY